MLKAVTDEERLSKLRNDVRHDNHSVLTTVASVLDARGIKSQMQKIKDFDLDELVVESKTEKFFIRTFAYGAENDFTSLFLTLSHMDETLTVYTENNPSPTFVPFYDEDDLRKIDTEACNEALAVRIADMLGVKLRKR